MLSGAATCFYAFVGFDCIATTGKPLRLSPNSSTNNNKISFIIFVPWGVYTSMTGYPLHRENRENDPKNSLSGKTQGIWKFCQNTGNLVCSICKFPDSKGKRYFESCCENLPKRIEACLPSQFCVCNSHKSSKLAQEKFAVGQGKYRENTGNLKIQFEWVP